VTDSCVKYNIVVSCDLFSRVSMRSEQFSVGGSLHVKFNTWIVLNKYVTVVALRTLLEIMLLEWKCFHYAVVVSDLLLLKGMHKYFCS